MAKDEEQHAALRAALPSSDTKRWVIRRKAAVVAAVKGGAITIKEACERYSLTEEEFLSWRRDFETHGLPGLRSTRLQQYRNQPKAIRGSRRRSSRSLTV